MKLCCMDGRQFSLNDIDIGTDHYSEVKKTIAAQTGIDEDEILFENGYGPEEGEDLVRYDPEMYLPQCASDLTELRIVVDSQRGEIMRKMKQVGQRNEVCPDLTFLLDYPCTVSKDMSITVEQINQYLASNPYDIELLLTTAVRVKKYNVECFPMSIMDDLVVMRRMVNTTYGWEYMRYMGPNCKNDEALVMEAVKQAKTTRSGCELLEHASPRLQDKEAFLLEVARLYKTGSVLYYASDRLKDDKAFIRSLILMDNDNDILRYASDAVQQDRELLQLAIAHDDENSCAWSHCPINIRLYDHDVLRQVIANELSQAEHDVWVGSISDYFEPYDGHYVDHRIRKDALSKLPDDIITSFLNPKYSTGSIFVHLSDSQRANKAFALAAVKACSENLEYVDKKLKEDKEIVCAAIRQCHSYRYGSARAPLCFVSETMRQDPDVQALVELLSPRHKRVRMSC